MGQRLKNIPERGFIGMNDREDPDDLKEGYCELAKDCLLKDTGIKKGPGTDAIFSQIDSNPGLGAYATENEVYIVYNLGDDSAAQIYRFTENDDQPVAVSGGGLTASLDVEFVDTGTAVYAMNGTDNMIKLVGATATHTSGLPKGKYGAWLNNRLYIAAANSKLWYSNANDPDTFGGSDNIEIDPDGFGDITALGVIGGTMIIGKENSIYSFNGYTEDDFTIKSIAEEFPNYGITSHRSIVNTGNDMLFMSFAGRVPHIRSIKRTINDKLNYGGTISKDVEGTMKEINVSRVDQVAGGFDGRYVWWSVPLNTSVTNNYTICYDTWKEGWTVHENMNAAVWFRSELQGEDNFYFISNDDGKCFVLNEEVGSRDSQAMEFEFKSRYYRPQLSRKSKFKYLYVTTGSNINTDISVYATKNAFTRELEGTINPSVNESTFACTFPFFFGETEDKTDRINLGIESCYKTQISFIESGVSESASTFPLTFPVSFGSDTNILIKDYELWYYPRGLRS
jgi:hypothetical protein